MYRNLTDALVGSLKLLLAEGAKVPSRNGHTLELYAHQMKIERPYERVLVTPGRGNNPFATLAETMWVVGGRDDMEYLSRYLPRATDFSDDGKTWRGAYGPRLRAWPRDEKLAEYSTTNPDPLHFVDQVEECVKILCEDIASRRAVMMIFDPGRDFVQSKDIPCNNWIHWLVRDGKLNMTVGVRSNDAIWGFSGINLYEWSVLQQMMANWVGAEPGIIAYTASSFHLYDYHFEKAQKMVERAKPKTLYDFGFKNPKFSVGFEDFRDSMAEFYILEERMWKNAGTPEAVVGGPLDTDISAISDEFLRTALQMLRVYQALKSGATREALVALLNRMPSCDLKIGALEFLYKQKELKDSNFLELALKAQAEKEFFDYYQSVPERDLPMGKIVEVLETLHDKKTRSYGNSWKKHGEVLGVFSNITRKRDRIISLRAGAKGTSDEGIFDTVADLGVYAAKYLTLLSDLFPEAFGDTFAPLQPSSDGTEGFNSVLEAVANGSGAVNGHDMETSSQAELWEALEEQYKNIEEVLTQPDRGGEKGERVTVSAAAMCLICLNLLKSLNKENPNLWAAFAASVEAL